MLAAQTVAQAAQGAVDKASDAARRAPPRPSTKAASFSATGALLPATAARATSTPADPAGDLDATPRAVVAAMTHGQGAIADAANQHAADLLKTATAKRDALVKQRAKVQKQVDKYTHLLATMSYGQRSAFQRATKPSVSKSRR